jgi:hypothetical protein
MSFEYWLSPWIQLDLIRILRNPVRCLFDIQGTIAPKLHALRNCVSLLFN